MSHLHIPDGVLPPGVWGAGLAAALLLLVWTSRLGRDASRQGIAYQGAIGALVLAAMALEVPLGPFEYHLTLLGPVGVLLGPAAAFQVMFVSSAILALVGHGGLTVVGLNALVLGAGAALATRSIPASALITAAPSTAQSRRAAGPGARARGTARARTPRSIR